MDAMTMLTLSPKFQVVIPRVKGQAYTF